MSNSKLQFTPQYPLVDQTTIGTGLYLPWNEFHPAQTKPDRLWLAPSFDARNRPIDHVEQAYLLCVVKNRPWTLRREADRLVEVPDSDCRLSSVSDLLLVEHTLED